MEREGGAYRNTLVTQGSLHTHGEGGRGVQKYISNTGQPTYTWRGRERGRGVQKYISNTDTFNSSGDGPHPAYKWKFSRDLFQGIYISVVQAQFMKYPVLERYGPQQPTVKLKFLKWPIREIYNP